MKFKIEWDDPLTQERCVTYEDFDDTPAQPADKNGFAIGPITAAEWAEDAAYSYADKGWHKVTPYTTPFRG